MEQAGVIFHPHMSAHNTPTLLLTYIQLSSLPLYNSVPLSYFCPKASISGASLQTHLDFISVLFTHAHGHRSILLLLPSLICHLCLSNALPIRAAPTAYLESSRENGEQDQKDPGRHRRHWAGKGHMESGC